MAHLRRSDGGVGPGEAESGGGSSGVTHRIGENRKCAGRPECERRALRASVGRTGLLLGNSVHPRCCSLWTSLARRRGRGYKKVERKHWQEEEIFNPLALAAADTDAWRWRRLILHPKRRERAPQRRVVADPDK